MDTAEIFHEHDSAPHRGHFCPRAKKLSSFREPLEVKQTNFIEDMQVRERNLDVFIRRYERGLDIWTGASHE